MTPEEQALLAAFRDGSLPASHFHHREHVRLAWIYLREYGLAEAVSRFSADLQAFAVAKGVPRLYHATITWSYLAVIAERRSASPPAQAWDDFASGNADLLQWKPSVLDAYYSAERLWSDAARAAFLMPDRAPGTTASATDGARRDGSADAPYGRNPAP